MAVGSCGSISIDMIKGLHIELTNICTLKCPGCARTQFIEQFPRNWTNHSIDIDVLLNFLDIDLDGICITFCGVYGDPIYHPAFLKIVKQFKQRGAAIRIVTNGSYKTKKWWESLVNLLDSNDRIRFSVDGLPENFTTYRVNADWKTIEVGMNVAAQSQCYTTWAYIPFSYNENDIDAARELCNSIGINEFVITHSERFDQSTEHLIPTNIESQQYAIQQNWKLTQTVDSISPKCSTQEEHYISADGFYVPCCYLADYRFYYKTQFGKNKKQYDISSTTFSKLIADKHTANFYQTLNQQPGCQFNCGSNFG